MAQDEKREGMAMQPREGRVAQKRRRKEISQISQSAEGDSSGKQRRVGQSRGLKTVKTKATKLSSQRLAIDPVFKLAFARRMSNKQLSTLRRPNLSFLSQNPSLSLAVDNPKVTAARRAQVCQKSTKKLSSYRSSK